MKRQISLQGKPLSLVGRPIETGMTAPVFQAVALDMRRLSLPGFDEKIKVITSFPSIDTPVCDLQVKEFNKRAAAFSSEVAVIAVSMDLPFAQKRFCDVNKIVNLTVVSDYQQASFGVQYGLLIKELHLLARAIIIVDKSNLIRYIQIVEELTHAPDYSHALAGLDQVLKNPAAVTGEKLSAHCTPCEAGTPALARDKLDELIVQHRGWELIEGKKIKKKFSFENFEEAKAFFDLIAALAQAQGHHPAVTLAYNKLTVTLTTHASGGLTENDFIMAKMVDEMDRGARFGST